MYVKERERKNELSQERQGRGIKDGRKKKRRKESKIKLGEVKTGSQ